MSYRDDEHTRGAFGELITAHKRPVVQITNKYHLDPSTQPELETFTATGGSVSTDENLFRCQTGTSVGGYGVVRSKETLNYHAGQGVEAQFTARFTTGIPLSLQFGGLFNLTDQLGFGYDGEDFSCIHSYNGKAEEQVITVTATGAGTCTVTLDDDAVGITVTSSSEEENAEELRLGLEADGTISGKWRFDQVGTKVHCIAKSASAKTGAFSISGGVTASIVEEVVGQAKTDNHTHQYDSEGNPNWNFQPTFDDFDPTKLNIYKIQFGYLGVANINFFIYNPDIGRFELVHQTKWASENAVTHISNPNFKIGWTGASLGSSGTDLTVEGASASLMVEGDEYLSNDVHAQDNTELSVGATATNILTIQNRLIHGAYYNLGKITPLLASVAIDHTKGAIIELIKNATITGVVSNYTAHEEDVSLVIYKTGGTVTGGDLIGGFPLSSDAHDDLNLEPLLLKLLPSDTLTISARAVSGTATSMTGFLTWKEDK